MVEPFSERVTSRSWLAEAEAWIHDRVTDAGRRLVGPIEQRRVRPWSTQLVAPTDRGRVWFKANGPGMAFEPALHDLLARLAPREVDAPLAIDPQRAWMLTADRGQTLGERHEPSVEDWQAVVVAAVRLQRDVLGHRDEILATGVADCAPETVLTRFDRLVERFRSLPSTHPSFVDDDLAAELQAARPRIEDAVAQVAGSPIPCTLQHGDLHPWNVFAPEGAGLRVFDFGDVQWAPAVEALFVPHGVIRHGGTLPWEPVRDAFVEQWSDLASPRTIRSLYEASAFTQPINRALTWWDSIVECSDTELDEYGDAPLHHLRRVLEA